MSSMTIVILTYDGEFYITVQEKGLGDISKH